MKTPKAAPRVRCLPRSWKTLGRSLGKRNRASFAQQALRDPHIKKNILTCLGKDIQRELSAMCSKKCISVFRECGPGKGRTDEDFYYCLWLCFFLSSDMFRAPREIQMG